MGGWQVQPGFGYIQSYAQAHERWLEGRGFSKRHTKKILAARSAGDDEGEHALDGPKKHMTMCLQSPAYVGDLYRKMGVAPRLHLRHYAFTYQRTDVVTYREDGAIFVQGYGSTSTNIMLNHLLPDDVRVHCKTAWQETSHVWSRDLLILDQRHDSPRYWHDQPGGREVYQLSTLNFMLERGEDTYILVNPERVTKPWISLSVNKPVARGILSSTRYHEFMRWARMYIHMERACKPKRLKYELDRNAGADTGLFDAEQARMYLSDVAYWPKLVALKAYHPARPSGYGWGHRNRFDQALQADPQYLGRCHADRLATGLRRALYLGSPDILDKASLPFVSDLKAAQACLASEARWED